MKFFRLLLVVLITTVLFGCKKKPEEIFNEEKSGVVLICNEFYYDITLANGNHIYFSGLDDKGRFVNLTSDLNEIRNNPGILNGTGFFIDDKGRILTNRHVAAPEVDKETVKENLNAIIEGYAEYIELLQDSMDQRYQAIQEYKEHLLYQNENDYDPYDYTDSSEINEDNNSYVNEDEYNALGSELDNLRQQYAQAQQMKNEVRSNILQDNFTIQLHPQYGIAYDGSNVQSWNDFMKQPCVMLRVSQDAGSDLALLQLKSQKTPSERYIFDLDPNGDSKDVKLEINQQVYMIGYNQGVTLAQTSNGINAQFTSGTITQQPDGNRVLYSIPAMQGSSGSPIVDDEGRLVAVNFASLQGSDNFNFGVPLLRILTFIK